MDPLRNILYKSDMTKSPQIRSYNLFGETAELADVLHIETVRSRSALHDWKLKPHRHGRLHQFLFLMSGGGNALFDGESVALESPCFVNIPRGVIHGFEFQPDTDGWVITLTSDLMDHSMRREEGVHVPLEHSCVLPLPPELRLFAEVLQREYNQQSFGRAHMLRHLAGGLIGLVARSIQTATPFDALDQHNPLFARFEALVERDFRKRRRLADYANDLAVSSTHLNRVAHQATGQPASHLVNERMLREARRMLIFTSMSAAEIAYDLGFSDPAHFSRVFAKGTGLPPREFRKTMSEPTA